jgi:hypothetical protein
MNPSTLNKLRWILIVLSPLFFILIPICTDIKWENHILKDICTLTTIILWIISSILVLVFFFYKSTSINPGLKRFLLFFIPVSISLILICNSYEYYSALIDYLLIYLTYNFIISLVLSLIAYLERIEIILTVLIASILVGFIINRLGFSDLGQSVLMISFGLSTIGFLYLGFISIKKIKENKIKGRIFVFFYSIFGVLNALLFIKFASYQPEYNSVFDTLGVIIFLLACLTLFIVLPFSDFTEWADSQRRSFKRLVFLPFILFLLIFSLRFLLPENTYRKIFFKEYSSNKIIHFDMEDYTLDFP